MATDFCVCGISFVLLSALFKAYPGYALVLNIPHKTAIHSIGDTVVLKCTSTANIPLEWTFTPSHDTSSHSVSRVQAGLGFVQNNTELYDSGTLLLMIRELQVNDAGVYQCAELHSNSANVIESVQLIIMEDKSTTRNNKGFQSTASFSAKLLALLEDRLTQAPGIVFLVVVFIGATLLTVIICVCCVTRVRRQQRELRQRQSDEECSACDEDVDNSCSEKSDSWSQDTLNSQKHLLHV